MSEIAIQVEGLSKRYKIGKAKQHTNLKEVVTTSFSRMLSVRRKRSADSEGNDTIWALKNVSFEVRQGEVVSIIGRNGAGKSTLLKILSRITEPTEGWFELTGRASSLLEVGTGFHPELTGRENIYLNGAILGMKKTEIDRNFDEIVAFAEIEKFLDTPVKHYSSGMYVRLAFAVAAHMDPDILLVDEVLTVGDIFFQRKCIDRMEKDARQGRTVIVVSHNLSIVRSLSSKCLYLRSGEMVSYDATDLVVQKYFNRALTGDNIDRERPLLSEFHRDSIAGLPVSIRRVWVNSCENEIPVIEVGEDFRVFIEIESTIQIRSAHLGVGILREDGVRVASILSLDQNFRVSASPGKCIVCCTLKGLPLTPGNYHVDVGISPSPRMRSWDVIQGYPLLEVEDRDGKILKFAGYSLGVVHWNNVIWECSAH